MFTRRRAIILLTLTSVLLITMDLRGSSVTSGARSAFGALFRPVESVARVATRPIENAWHGITDYNAVVNENKRLKDQVAYDQGAGISAVASVREAQELLSLNGLPTLAGINSCTAQVVGESPSNYTQTVEINRGTECGIKVGMPVLNAAGLIGKVTDVFVKRAVVMLITDPEYSLAVKVVNVPATTTTTTVPLAPGETSFVTAPTTTTTTTTTTIPKTTTTQGIKGFTPGSTIATIAPVTTQAPAVTVNTAATNSTGSSSTITPSVTTTTTIAPSITVPAGADVPLRETGALEGRGLSQKPVVRFIESDSRFGSINIGSPIISAGGATSLAPPDIVLGTVSRVINRQGTLGPILEVKVAANLDSLNFVRVLLYQPSTEKATTP
jgi:rod shape-determining protein MreC